MLRIPCFFWPPAVDAGPVGRDNESYYGNRAAVEETLYNTKRLYAVFSLAAAAFLTATVGRRGPMLVGRGSNISGRSTIGSTRRPLQGGALARLLAGRRGSNRPGAKSGGSGRANPTRLSPPLVGQSQVDTSLYGHAGELSAGWPPNWKKTRNGTPTAGSSRPFSPCCYITTGACDGGRGFRG